MMIQLTVNTPEQMEQLGARIARQLSAGSLVALNGELGAGKTTLTRGIGAGLGVRGRITSPTFVLARTHPRATSEPPLVHVDAYRLSSAAELDDLDIDFEGSIVVVEWAEGMLHGITDSWLEVNIRRSIGHLPFEGEAGDDPGDDAQPREVTLISHGPLWQERLTEVAAI